MTATFDKSQRPTWLIDMNEPPPNKELEQKHYDLMMAIAKAVTEAAINNSDEFAFLIYYTAQIFQTGFDYMKENKQR
jgi:hypothetical protein